MVQPTCPGKDALASLTKCTKLPGHPLCMHCCLLNCPSMACIQHLTCYSPAMLQFTEAVVNLKFDEEPKYSPYAQLFEALCGPGPQRPIQMEASVAKVGQKRQRESSDEDNQDIVRHPAVHASSCCATLEYDLLWLPLHTLVSGVSFCKACLCDLHPECSSA